MLSVLENRRPAPRLPRRRRAVPRAAGAESREGEAAGGAQAEADEEAPAGRGRRDGRAFQLHVAVVDGEGGGLRRVPAPGHAPKTASVTMGLTPPRRGRTSLDSILRSPGDVLGRGEAIWMGGEASCRIR